MPSEAVALPNFTALRAEALEARYLASMFKNDASVADLLAYASALEAEASG